MKKFKKILAAVSAAALCALPAMNGFAADEASESGRINTYKVYCDISKNSGIKRATFVIDYNDMDIAKSKIKGNLGGTLTDASVTTPDYEEFGILFESSTVLMNPGTLFASKFTTNHDFNSCLVRMQAEGFDKSLSLIKPSPINIDIVLMGDVNNDGEVDIMDVININRYLMDAKNVSINLRAADVNDDGIVTKEDSDMVLSYTVQIIEHFWLIK